MEYNKTILCKQSTFAEDTARTIEATANHYAKEGWRVVSFSLNHAYFNVIILLERPVGQDIVRVP